KDGDDDAVGRSGQLEKGGVCRRACIYAQRRQGSSGENRAQRRHRRAEADSDRNAAHCEGSQVRQREVFVASEKFPRRAAAWSTALVLLSVPGFASPQYPWKRQIGNAE